MLTRELDIPLPAVTLQAVVRIPVGARALILFAHGSGSGRHSPRNNFVAEQLAAEGMATVLSDLLSAPEEALDASSGRFRFDIPLLTKRLLGVTDWARRDAALGALPAGYFGASTGAAAALAAAAHRPEIGAIVSRGGRPDLLGSALAQVRAPTLLIVGGEDAHVLELNRSALSRLGGPARLQIVPHATHLFVEPGALEQVAARAVRWFRRYLLEPPMQRSATRAPRAPERGGTATAGGSARE